ncbi:long-chain-fatty-acid--CoA ligase [Streptomyces sp. NPDC058266]|uniref:long-chain-fatty-acid--CoA ligase n=1 Tax=Streptomyces sp. NPDC058266 TaxID=3346412 RepID=UPI0036ECC482
MNTLDAVLATHAAERPEKVALVCDGRRVTYGAIAEESDRWARALRASGLAPGARVGYLGKESEHYYELLYACAKSGVVLVPVNWRLTPHEVDHILRDSESELVFVEEEFLDVAGKVQADLPKLKTTVLLDCADPAGIALPEWKAAGTERAEPWPATPDTPIVQLYTSGTTGFPKGVVLAHRSFFAVRESLATSGEDWIDWRPDDVSLIGVPGSHIGGLWWATQGFNAGITNVTMRVFAAKDAIALVRDLGVTVTCVVPAMLLMLLAEPDVDRSDFATLRKVVYGGSPISESLLRRCMDVMKCEFAQIYGLTETGNTAICLPPAAHLRGGDLLKAAGRPYPGFAVKIVDGQGGQLPAGEVGEVCIRTPGRMVEYWRLPEATEQTLVDGWIHTGDAGYTSDEGYLFIHDRIKDMIIRAGENIYPAEIENALSAHPDVVDVAVIGVPDSRWGEAVHAFVQLRPGERIPPRELKAFLRDRIADYKIPSKYEFIDRVPRNASGKILRRTLRDGRWSSQDRQVN